MHTVTVTVGSGSRINVHVGDALTFDTVLDAHTSPQTEAVSHTVPLAKLLGFAPSKIFKYLRKGIGERVERGEVVAVKDSVLSSRKYTADISGIIASIDHHTGEITIGEAKDSHTGEIMTALVEGSVVEVDNASFTIKVAKVHHCDLTSPLSHRLGGRVLLVDEDSAPKLTLPDVKDHIVVLRGATEYTLTKIEALGASYVVVDPATTHRSSHTLTLERGVDMDRIVDFGPFAVYANAGEKMLTFYR